MTPDETLAAIIGLAWAWGLMGILVAAVTNVSDQSEFFRCLFMWPLVLAVRFVRFAASTVSKYGGWDDL